MNNVDTILKSVTEATGFSIKDLAGKRRLRQVTHARHSAMIKLREHTNLSYAKIGKIFNRHYSTVMAAINKRNI